jgi:hypothetical protein
MKTCTKCKLSQSINNFYNDRKRKDGLNPWCKTCDKESRRKYFANNSSARAKAVARSTKYRTTHKEKTRAAGRRYYENHKEAEQRRGREYYRNNPEKQSERLRKQKYNLSPEDYKKMLGAQKGLCAICAHQMKKPHVDHNHRTGKIRALLCLHCNHGIGNCREQIYILERMIKYLKDHEQQGES